MSAPENRKYTKTHEWVSLEGDIATVGLTDHAQQELGDITYLELPEAGDAISAGEPFGVVESVKAASDVYSPINGEILERNDAAIDAPEVINQSPYDSAWLIRVKVSDPSQLESLLDAKAYDTFVDEQGS
jgi:glycine cleavage system H protein